MKPLSKADFDKFKKWFRDFKAVINVLEAKVPGLPTRTVGFERWNDYQ